MTRRILIPIIALLVAVAASPAVPVAYAVIPPPPIAVKPATLDTTATADAATKRVLELQQSVSDVQAEQISIDNRIVVTSRLILEQQSAVDRSTEEYQRAQAAYNERAIAMYKFTGYDSLAVLLDAASWKDFVSRVSILTTILQIDRTALEEAAVVAAQAQFLAGQLEDLRAQDVELRGLRDDRARILQTALTEEQQLLPPLTQASRVAVDTVAKQYTSTRARWKAASIPIGTVIRKVPGRVLPYTDRTYLVSEFHYRTYRTTGVAYRAVCSWYGADFNGRGTASGQVYNMEDFTCAHKTLPFGTWLALTRYDSRSKAYRRIVVVVNDRGPYIKGRDIDLSKAAAEALGLASAGVGDVSVEVVTPVIR
jgi:rare lipoprotein A (peptidoglycan hydrolase)